MAFPPNRIVCLTEETVETLYLLGEQDRIVGVSGFVVRPPEARRDKPRVSTFTDADTDKILALEPDLVFAFSDIQADIVASLIRKGLHVHCLNHRTVDGVFDMMRMVGAIVGAEEKTRALVAEFEGRLAAVKAAAEQLPRRPKVFFEEWDEPFISAIGWVSDLIEIAGGDNVFAGHAKQAAAMDRVVTIEDVVAAQPEIIIGSWCGKKFQKDVVRARPGFDTIPAVRNNQIHEIKSSIILQPGPAAIGDGANELAAIIKGWSQAENAGL